jgi:hypothetical protein
MKLPGTKSALSDEAVNIAKQCMNDVQDRMDQYVRWRNYTYSGCADVSKPAILNKVGPHIDRTSSQLFSPSEVRFLVEFGTVADKEWQQREYTIGRHLSDEFHGSNADLCFSEGVNWALVYGAAFTKTLWNVGKTKDGRETGGKVDPHLVMPYQIGVWRPDINGLDRQEAFCHVTYIGRSDLWRRLAGHSDRDSIMAKVGKASLERTEDDIDNIVHQVIIGGITPVTQGTASGTKGTVDVSNFIGLPQLSHEAARDLVRFVELWIKDDDRGDYTTLQYVDPDILIEGGDKKRNIFMDGHHPFRLIQPNPQRGLFWGRSEIADLQLLQDILARRLDDIAHIWRLRAQPPRALIGFSQLTDEARAAFSSPNGLIMNENPNAKIEPLAPDLPQEAFQQVDSIVRYFDETAGFPAVMRGEGEPGMRSGQQTDSMTRTASARLRDRALIVERECAEMGALVLDILRDKDPTSFPIEGTTEGFLLDQMPDIVKVTVDSHSSSPAFTSDHRQLAFSLARAQAIGPEGLLRLVNPPQLDMLLNELHEKEKRQAELMRQHPELLEKSLKGGKKK